MRNKRTRFKTSFSIILAAVLCVAFSLAMAINAMAKPADGSKAQASAAGATTLTDVSTGLSVKGVFAQDSSLEVAELSDEEIAELGFKVPEGKIAEVFRIAISPDESANFPVRISIPVPSGFDQDDLVLEYLDADSEEAIAAGELLIDEIKGELVDENYEFDADRLGVFAFVSTPEETGMLDDSADDPESIVVDPDDMVETREADKTLSAASSGIDKVRSAGPASADGDGDGDDPTKAYVTVIIDWQDFENVYGIRPEQVTITGTINKGATRNMSFTMGAADGWKKKVEIPGTAPADLNGGYWNWYMSDVTTPMYESYSDRVGHGIDDTRTVTITPKLSTTSISGQVFWDDGSNASSTRPSKVNFTVTYADGTPVPVRTKTMSADATRKSGNTSYDESVKASISLPAYLPDKTRAQYDVVLGSLPTNYLPPEDISTAGSTEHKFRASLDSVDYTVNIDWEDNDNARLQRPASVDLTLLANGEPHPISNGTVMVSTANNTYTWTNLPRVDANGNEIAWSVRENPLVIHDTTYSATSQPDENGQITSTVTNVLRDDWNYAIDLKWDTPTLSERYDRKVVTTAKNSYTQKYSLDISVNSRTYEPGEMEVRMPYALWVNRDGTPNVPREQDIGVPQAPNHNSQYSYNYRIDKHDSTDPTKWEIVYTNWKKLEAGTNETITVIYHADALNTIDMSKAVLTATGHAKGDGQADYETQVSPTITFQMDTGARITSLQKDAACIYKRDDISMPGSVRNKLNLDIENYNYVQYYIHVKGEANQPYRVVLKDTFQDDGVLVAWAESANGVGNGTCRQSGNTATWTFPVQNPANSGAFLPQSLVILVRYPRDPNATYTNEDPTIYHNTMTGEVFATDDTNYQDTSTGDKNDHNTQNSNARAIAWHDYDFSYDYVYQTRKDWLNRDQYGSTRLQLGQDSTTCSAYAGITVNGFDLGEYQLDVYDEDLFWTIDTTSSGYGKYKRMTSEDYEITRGRAYIYYHSVNRRTGETINTPNLTTEPFVVYGRTDKGEWQKVTQFTLSPNATTTQMDIPEELLAGKGYTGLRVLSPANLRDYVVIQLYVDHIRIKADSPQVLDWIAKDEAGEIDLGRIYLLNIGSFKIFRKNAAGESYLYNPAGANQNAAARDLGLYTYDLSEYGKRIEHYSDVEHIDETYFTDKIGKRTVRYDNDTTHSLVDVVFDLAVGEQGEGTEDMYADVLDELLWDTGTFYDLLPKGYEFKPEAGVKVRCADNRSAIVTDTQVIDDWRGTGRQMVIFKVKNMAGENTNLGRVSWITPQSQYSQEFLSKRGFATGFSLEFTAQVTWAALTFNPTGYNHVVFEKDGPSFKGRTTDYLENASFPDDGSLANKISDSVAMDLGGKEAARRIFADIDDDDDTGGKNIMYYYSTVNPQIAQAIEVGINKEVKGVSPNYSNEDRAALGEQYKYRLDLTTSDNGITKDVVLYDILEDAANTEGHSGEVPWKGTFAGTNTAFASALGIAPVIYYSTVTGLDYNDLIDPTKGLDISNTDIWTTQKPENNASITAIAFDLSTGVDGEPYEFENRSTVNVEIIMDAPDVLPADPAQIYAYNRPAYSSDYIPQGNVEPTYMSNIGRRVVVTLFDPQELQFTKLGERLDHQTGESIEGEPLAGAQFSLYMCSNMDPDHVHSAAPGSTGSCWGTSPIWTTTSGEDGLVKFSNLDTGHYYLKEIDTPTAYIAPTGYWTFEVDARGRTVSRPVAHGDAAAFEGDAENGFTLTNPVRKTRFDIYKSWDDGGTYQFNPALYRPDELTFDIYQNGVLYRTVTLNKEQYSSAYLIENLEYCDSAGRAYTYTVQERPVDYYEGTVGSTTSVYHEDYRRFPVTNKSTTSALVITKSIRTNTSGGAGEKLFDFTVTLKDANGDPITGTFPLLYTTAGSNNNGTPIENPPATEITFDENGVGHLKAGYNKRAHIYHLPMKGTYEVVEDGIPTDSSADGWYLYSSTTPSGNLGAEKNGHVSYASFSNWYQSYGYLVADITKTLNRTDPGDIGYDGKFTFSVYSINKPGAANNRLVATGVNEGDEVVFTSTSTLNHGALVTTQQMGYSTTTYYAVSEDTTVPAGVTRDTNTYFLKVVWTDNTEGSMVPEIEYYSDRNFTKKLGDGVEFKNTIPITGTGQIAAVKHLDGNAPGEGAYTFELVDEATDEVLETVPNAADGSVTFSAMSYNQNDVGVTKSFLIREVAGDDDSIIYDDAVCRATITPTMKLDDEGQLILDCTPVYTFVGEDEATGGPLFNNFTLVSISGTKIWDDADNQDGIRPGTVEFKLQRKDNGEWTDVDGATASISDDETTYTFHRLQAYDADGNAIEYRVVETTETEGYEATGGTLDENYAITNTHEPEKLDISGTKTWADDDLAELEGYERPESIEVTLSGLAGGQTVYTDTVTVASDDAGAWEYAWTGLDKYYRGSEIAWEVSEDMPAGYTAEQGEGTYDIVNVPLESIEERTPVSIDVFKVDADDPEKGLSGAEFELRDAEGELLTTLITNRKGIAKAEFTETGSYTITETKAPTGYQNPETTYSVEVTETGPVVSFDEERQLWVHTYTLSAECKDVVDGVLTVPDPPEPEEAALPGESQGLPTAGDGAPAVIALMLGLIGVGGALLGARSRRRRFQ